MQKPVMQQPFASRGFYLHASWQYDYPFAVRRWRHADFDGMFRLLRAMGMDKVMIWPMTEIAPPPLSSEDRAHFMEFRKVVQNAQDSGLECWLVFTPCLTTTEAVREDCMQDRVFYPNRRTLRFDDAKQYEAYMAHLHDLLSCLNNASGYVFIDGDPGGYPDAQPEDFMRMLHDVRRILSDVGSGNNQKIIPWIWCGWGDSPEGGWSDADRLRSLVAPFLDAFTAAGLSEPWELLPGRSNPDRANMRINLDVIEEAGLIDKSTLLAYECVELEPTPPAFVLQFDQIRQVVREELPLASIAIGIMANAQQPICAMHNLFYFSRCAAEPSWLDRSNEDVLASFAEFLGGDPDILTPALRISNLPLDKVPADLAQSVRASVLRSEAAQWLPGGPVMYLDLLADFVESHVAVLQSTQDAPISERDAVERISVCMTAMLKWWSRHRYVSTGHLGSEYRPKFTVWDTKRHFFDWMHELQYALGDSSKREIVERMLATGLIKSVAAEASVDEVLSWRDHHENE